MRTCIDCVYVPVCQWAFAPPDANQCVDFKDKAMTTELPCKIGDRVWAIRNYKGFRHPQEGVVSDMCFTNDMNLVIVIKHVARGEWGKTVFRTREETEEAIRERGR